MDYSLMRLPTEEIGRALANADNHAQADVINILAKELMIVCRDPELTGPQSCYIAEALDKNGKLLIKALSEFIDLREKAEA